jgi:hypothetical protein
MATPDDLLPGWPPPPPPPSGRRDLLFVTVLLGLLALTVFLWFTDPAHQFHGKSRVDWPAASPGRP